MCALSIPLITTHSPETLRLASKYNVLSVEIDKSQILEKLSPFKKFLDILIKAFRDNTHTYAYQLEQAVDNIRTTPNGRSRSQDEILNGIFFSLCNLPEPSRGEMLRTLSISTDNQICLSGNPLMHLHQSTGKSSIYSPFVNQDEFGTISFKPDRVHFFNEALDILQNETAPGFILEQYNHCPIELQQLLQTMQLLQTYMAPGAVLPRQEERISQLQQLATLTQPPVDKTMKKDNQAQIKHTPASPLSRPNSYSDLQTETDTTSTMPNVTSPFSKALLDDLNLGNPELAISRLKPASERKTPKPSKENPVEVVKNHMETIRKTIRYDSDCDD